MPKDTYDLHLAQLADKREPAMAQAREMVRRGEYDAAVAAVRAADDSIYGCVAAAKLLEEHLKELCSRSPRPDSPTLKRAFDAALCIAQNCYPDPHTQLEADDFNTARAEDRARLVEILGYDPGA